MKEVQRVLKENPKLREEDISNGGNSGTLTAEGNEMVEPQENQSKVLQGSLDKAVTVLSSSSPGRSQGAGSQGLEGSSYPWQEL